MALDDLVGSTTQNGPMGNMFFGNSGGNSLGRYLGDGNHSILQPSQPSVGQYPPSGIASIEGGFNNRLPNLDQLPGHNFHRIPLPVRPDFGFRPGPIMGLQPAMPDYSSQFENFGETLGGFGEQLTGFGDQMTGYQDALGSFNEQMGGMGKQFETINNRLDSVDKGLGSLGNQIASFENMQKAQPQQVMQPQRPAFSPFGFGGFGGLGSLFGRRY